MKQKNPIAVRPSDEEMALLKKAAELEHRSMAQYCLLASMVYTREHHPELFAKS